MPSTDSLQDLIASYKSSEASLQNVRKVPFLTFTGVSGAGKDTIIGILIKTGDYHLIVSHTTRAKRQNHGIWEVDGADYHFIDETKAATMLKNQEFVEAKSYNGNIYGTSSAEFIEASGASKIAIGDIDIQGLSEYVTITDNIFPIFLLPPDYDTWMYRMNKRYGDNHDASSEDIQRRKKIAAAELGQALSMDKLLPVINSDSASTAERIARLVRGEALSNSERKQGAKITHQLLKQLI